MASEVKKEEKKNVWDSTDVKIVYEGRHFVFPNDPEKISYDNVIRIVQRIKASEEQRYDVSEMVEGAPWDALVSVAKAMHAIYGVVIAESVQTFFGEIKPQLVTIQTGPELDDNIQVAMGQMQLPNITAPVTIGLHPKGCYIMGTVMRKDRDAVVQIAVKAREILRTDSIYKGKAIELSVDEDGELQLTVQPKFLDLKNVREADLIHTQLTTESIDNNIFGPLKYTEACRLHRIPLKRGILLEGKYGTGKTLTAKVTAKVAEDNGWTFIMLNKCQGLGAAIEFARNYQPCVIFAEDIDRHADRDDEEVNELVNLLDGLDTKDMEMMTVLTTNHIEDIDKALLRPGRFDAVISIEAPDAETAIRVVRHYARELIPGDVDLSELGQALDGKIPATIREVVERSKVLMLMKGRNLLESKDLLSTANGMAKHMALLEDKQPEPTLGDRLKDAFIEVVQQAAGLDTTVIDNVAGEMRNIRRGQAGLARTVNDKLEETNAFARAAAGSAEKASERATAAVNVSAEGRDISRADLKTTEKVLKAIGG